jgi:hypothetical protein
MEKQLQSDFELSKFASKTIQQFLQHAITVTENSNVLVYPAVVAWSIALCKRSQVDGMPPIGFTTYQVAFLRSPKNTKFIVCSKIEAACLRHNSDCDEF